MNKDLIKKHLKETFLKEEGKPVGLTATEKIQKDEEKVNKNGLKDMEKDLGDYDKSLKFKDENDIETNKVNYATDDQKTYHDEMEILNGQEMLRYTNEPNKLFKERAEEAIVGSAKMGNETKTGKWNPETGEGNGNTEPVWGASKADFGKELVKRIKDSSKKREDATPPLIQFGNDIELEPEETKKKIGYTRTAVEETKVNNKTNIKENTNKMKRLKFNKPFSDLGNALNLIPESYKVDKKVFEMADGNMNIKIRWEGSLTEGKAIVLQASDKKLMNEDIQKMKHLFGYKSQDTLGLVKGKDRITENESFSDIFNKTKKLLMTENTDIESVKAETKEPANQTIKVAAEAKKEIEGSVKTEKALPNAEKPTEGQFDEAANGIAKEAKENIEGSVLQTKDTPETIKVKTAEFDKAGIKVAPEATKHIHLKENDEESEEGDVEVNDDYLKPDADDNGSEEKEPAAAEIKKETLPIDNDSNEDDEIKVPQNAFKQVKLFTKKQEPNQKQEPKQYIIVATKENGEKEYIDVPEKYVPISLKNANMALNKIIADKELQATEPQTSEIEEGLFGGNDKARTAKEQEFNSLNAKLIGTKGDQTANKEKWLQRAKDDGYRGNFVIDRGVLQYKSKPLMPATGGSSGFGTANEEVK